MLTPAEAEEARLDMRAFAAGTVAGLMVIGASQTLAALLRFILWVQS